MVNDVTGVGVGCDLQSYVDENTGPRILPTCYCWLTTTDRKSVRDDDDGHDDVMNTPTKYSQVPRLIRWGEVMVLKKRDGGGGTIWRND